MRLQWRVQLSLCTSGESTECARTGPRKSVCEAVISRIRIPVLSKAVYPSAKGDLRGVHGASVK